MNRSARKIDRSFGLLLICSITLGLSIVALQYCYKFRTMPINEFGVIKIGEKIPGFSGSSELGIPIGTTKPDGRFYIHFINDQAPISGLDMECGRQAEIVVNNGGHLMASRDYKYAKMLGVKLISQRPSRFNASLMVVTDSQATIVAIYKNAKLKDLQWIVPEILPKV